MKYFVKWEVFDTLAESQVRVIKDGVARRLEQIKKSGKMTDGGALLGIRGGYFIFDIADPGELLSLLGPVLWDNCRIQSFPVVSYEELGRYLESTMAKAA